MGWARTEFETIDLGDAGNGEAQGGPGEPLGLQRAGAPGLLEGGRGHCGQERQDVQTQTPKFQEFVDVTMGWLVVDE